MDLLRVSVLNYSYHSVVGARIRSKQFGLDQRVNVINSYFFWSLYLRTRETGKHVFCGAAIDLIPNVQALPCKLFVSATIRLFE